MKLKTSLLLLFALQTMQADVITTTFGPDDSFTPNVGWRVGEGAALGLAPDEFAVEFTPAVDAILSSVRIAVFRSIPTNGDGDLVINLSAGELPGAPIESFETTIRGPSYGQVYAFTSTRQPFLAAGHPYWLVLSSNDLVDNSFGWDFNNIGAYSQIAEWSPGLSLWDTIYNASPVFEISGTPASVSSVPEPRPVVLVGAALLGSLLLALHYRAYSPATKISITAAEERRRVRHGLLSIYHDRLNVVIRQIVVAALRGNRVVRAVS